MIRQLECGRCGVKFDRPSDRHLVDECITNLRERMDGLEMRLKMSILTQLNRWFPGRRFPKTDDASQVWTKTNGAKVYFITDDATGLIKIGRAMDVEQRLKGLQTGAPGQLRVLADMDGGAAGEADMHRRFAHLRVRGEWFSPGDDLLQFIEALAAATPEDGE